MTTAAKVFHLPSEIIEQIGDHCDTTFTLAGIYSLRLTCRCFSTALIPRIASQRTINVYLDDAGLRDFERLERTRLGPYVTRLAVGVRHIEGTKVVFKQSPVVQRNLVADHGAVGLDSHPVHEMRLRALLHHLHRSRSPKAWFRNKDHARATAESLGFSMTHDNVYCDDLEEAKELRPGPDVIGRFYKILKQHFLRLRSLHALDQPSFKLVEVQNTKYQVVYRCLVNSLPALSSTRSGPVCVCPASSQHGCRALQPQSRPFALDLARVAKLVEDMHEVPIFILNSTLKELQLMVPSKIRYQSWHNRLRSAMTVLSRFIGGCHNLEVLRLEAQDEDGLAIPVLLDDIGSRGPNARLHTLQIEHVNPTGQRVRRFVNSHKSLQLFHLRHGVPNRHPKQMVKFLKSILAENAGMTLWLEYYNCMPLGMKHWTLTRPLLPQVLPATVNTIIAELEEAFGLG